MINYIPVRFFKWNDIDRQDELDTGDTVANEFVECDEAEFLEAEGVIEYQRNTIFENGVSQICLTKNPFHNC